MKGGKLRAAVLGLGVGEQHALACRAHPRCELAAVCDFDPAKLALAAERFPEARRTAEAGELLDDPEIDLVCVATWDNFHCDQVVRALEQGKHVFAEKPLCLSEEEARRIRAALRARPGLRLSSNLILRRSPRFLFLKEKVERGKLGRLFYAEADYDYGRLHKITHGWRGRLDFYSAVYGGAIHVVDLLLWLTGDRVTEVVAFGNDIASCESSFRNFDLVASLLRFESGMIAKVTANFGCVFPHFHALGLYGTGATFLNGRGHASWFERGAREGDPPAEQRVDAPYPGVAKGELMAGFLDSLLDGGEPPVTEEEVFASLAVCFAIERAAHEGGTVTVCPL